MLVKENKYILSEDKDFFILLRIGLWQRVVEPLSESPDWSYIYKLAVEQTVQGIIADGIGLYRKQYPDLNITQEQNDKFLSVSAQIVRRNYSINQLQARICKLFNEANITYVILKGQAVAQCYPKPNLRCSGDIDYYLDDENFPKAATLLAQIADDGSKHQESETHHSYDFGGLEVELHASEADSIEMQHIFRQVKDDMLSDGNFSYYTCNDVQVTCAPPAYDAAYTFMHFVKHYYLQGIGLRQLCDWTLLLSSKHNDIEPQMLLQIIAKTLLLKQWDSFLAFSQLCLGLPAEIASKYRQTNSSAISPRTIWQECKSSGNFGHNDSNPQTEWYNTNFLLRNSYLFLKAHKRYFRRVWTDPAMESKLIRILYKNYLNTIFKRQ